MIGRILASSCGKYIVRIDENSFSCTAKGIFRNQNKKPVVGDLVDIDEIELTINKILDRKSFLKRPLIANLDHIIIVSSLKQPEFSYELIFKYLTYANLHNVKASLVVTKVDLGNIEKIEEIKGIFIKLGIKTYFINNKTKEGIEDLKPIFKDSITCLMGQSGVGKSSLLNAIDGEYKRGVGEYSKALHRGKHETKEVILLPFNDGFIADTPGFSSLDLGMYKEDIATYFPLINKYYTKCFYNDCLHISEDKCYIKTMLKNNELPTICYEYYVKLISEAKYKKERFSK